MPFGNRFHQLNWALRVGIHPFQRSPRTRSKGGHEGFSPSAKSLTCIRFIFASGDCRMLLRCPAFSVSMRELIQQPHTDLSSELKHKPASSDNPSLSPRKLEQKSRRDWRLLTAMVACVTARHTKPGIYILQRNTSITSLKPYLRSLQIAAILNLSCM